ncbi:MAG: DUF4446 family protein [Dethiobacter sp.]|nr:DUF4446 family protein [Dethiobacter sp.]
MEIEILVYMSMGTVSLALIFILILYRKVLFLSRRYREFMRGNSGVSLEVVLGDLLKELQKVEAGVDENRQKMKGLADVLATATQGIGVVRFNAFQNTGSDLSFAVALLNAHKNGVVISSIYGREESRTYAKPVSGGQSPYQLGGEEQEALRRALDSMHPAAK